MNFHELLGVDSLAALNFFHSNLRDEVEGSQLTARETLYVASVLASFAQTSCIALDGSMLCSHLGDVFDDFIYLPRLGEQEDLLEIAGARTLLFAGFFRGRMRDRYNLNWCDKLGSGFYERASASAKSKDRGNFFSLMSRNFPSWTYACYRLEKTLSKRRYFLQNLN